MVIIYASALVKINKGEGFQVKCTSGIKILESNYTKANSSTPWKMGLESSITVKESLSIKESSEQAKKMDGANLSNIKVNGKRTIMMDGENIPQIKYSIKDTSFKVCIMEWVYISRQKQIKLLII